jgi:hypothetical protein
MAARAPRMYGGRSETEREGAGEREPSFEKYQCVSIA